MAMNEPQKWCPLLSITPTHQSKQDCLCMKEGCGWWVERNGCCALVSLSTEINAGFHDLGIDLERLGV